MKMQDALELVLLFHSGGEWSDARWERWRELSGNREACTRVLCDCVREALGEEPHAICVMEVEGWDSYTPGTSIACPIHIPGHVIPPKPKPEDR